MRKIFVIIISLSLIFSLGCSFEKEQSSEKQNIEEKSQEETSQEETSQEENINTLRYEEMAKISEVIDLEDYNINVETDNQGTRVIIFEKDERKVYKSIFVKEKKHLKLIDLESNEKPLINESI